MPTKNYSIHPFVSLCLCDDKVFVGPKKFESIWRAIRMETGELLYKLMSTTNVNEKRIIELQRRESQFQYQVLCVSARPFTKKRLGFECPPKSRRSSYRRVAKPPSDRLFSINECQKVLFEKRLSNNTLCGTQSLETKRMRFSHFHSDPNIPTKSDSKSMDYTNVKDIHSNKSMSRSSDSCWLTIRQNLSSIHFHRN